MRFAPGSGCLVFGLGDEHFKMPLSPAARRGLVRECRGEALARKDSFWARHMLRAGRLWGGFLKHSPRGALTVTENDFHHLLSQVKKRLELLSPASGGWAAFYPRSLSLPGSDRDLGRWLEHLFAGEPRGSVHGDFCRSNCVRSGNLLALIDWSNFRVEFWVPYDTLHYEVVALADRNSENWVQCLKKLLEARRINRRQAARYVICRCELEADQDTTLGRLSEPRQRKYNDALRWAADELSV